LVNLVVAVVAQGSDTVVCRLEASALAVTHLVGMGCDNRTILYPALLARGFPHSLQELVISVRHVLLWWV
jgi:hypothetical protein